MPTLACSCKGCHACAGRCPNTVRRGKCDACMVEKRKHETMSEGRAERKKLYDTKRWRAMRRMQLYEHPFCQWVEDEETGRLCNRAGEEVDHIIPRAQRRDLEWERSNLQTLCHTHHSMKTAMENNLGAKRSATLRLDD